MTPAPGEIYERNGQQIQLIRRAGNTAIIRRRKPDGWDSPERLPDFRFYHWALRATRVDEKKKT